MKRNSSRRDWKYSRHRRYWSSYCPDVEQLVQVTGNTLSTDKLTLLGGSAYSTVGISS